MSDWTDERVEQLKSLHSQGLSCARIAAALGGVSRNGVIGKISRLGLHGPRQTRTYPKCAPAPKVARILDPEPILPHELAHISGEKVTLLTVKDGLCRFPLGDPGAADFHFCGHPTAPSKAYCPAHCAVAYVPAQPLKRLRA